MNASLTEISSLSANVPLRAICGGILMVTASASAVAITDMDLLDAVNAKRKPAYQIGLWDSSCMYKEIRGDYRAHYPDARLLKRSRALTIASFAAFAGAVICFFTS